MLRVLCVAAALPGYGCAYFHPAFMTQPASVKAAAQQAQGVLVCKRESLTRQSCGRMSRQELSHALSDSL
jgi:hypothetical protein